MLAATERLDFIEVAVFDLDGTLFDSAWLWDRIDIEFLKRRGKTPTKEYKRGLAALGTRNAAVYTIEYYGLDDTPEELCAEWMEMARAAYETEIKLLDGTLDALKYFRACGVRLVAATSLAAELAHACLNANGIADFFERVFIADEIGHNKSTPEFFLHISNALGVAPSECIVFDDVASVAESARAAGMTAYVIGAARK